jgi:LysR family transcriptional regulator, low CO2-responsive transcriptional regulator
MVPWVSITLTQLRSFLAVVRTGSVTEAADELVVTQPSVSAAVTALARELGTALLEREGRGVRPTAAGAAFAPFAADVIGLLEKGRRTAQETAASGERVLRIAAVTTAAESFVPALMHAFSAAHPDIGLTLSVGNRGRVMEMVLEHDADVAFGGRPPRDERLETHAFAPNELVLITAPEDPLATGALVSTGELESRSWLLREPGSGTRTVNEEFLAGAGLDVATLTVGSNGAIKQAARAGLGVSFVSRDAVDAELEAGILGSIVVESPPAPRQWHVMRSHVGPPRPIVEEFVRFVRDTAAHGELGAVARALAPPGRDRRHGAR